MNKTIKQLILIFALVFTFSLVSCVTPNPTPGNLGSMKLEYNGQDEVNVEKLIQAFSEELENDDIPKEGYSVVSDNSEVIEIVDGEVNVLSAGVANLTFVKGDINFEIEVKINLEMVVKYSETMKVGGAQSLSIKFYPESSEETYTVTSSDEEIASVYSTNKIKGLKEGTVTITIVSESGITEKFELTVDEATYKITYNIQAENLNFVKGDMPEEYSTGDLPLKLPTIERSGYAFLGWQINPIGDFYVKEDLIFELPKNQKGNVVLKPILEKVSLQLRHESTSVVEPGEQLKIDITLINVTEQLSEVVWKSYDEDIAIVDEYGNVTGVSDGIAEIFAYLKNMPEINMSITVSVQTGVNEMSDILEYFKTLAITEIQTKQITVSAYQGDYKTYIYSGVSYYLFENLNIIEQMTAVGTENRPGKIFDKKYITVHDTASGAASATAQAHANYVNAGGEGTSWHYTVGNDGIFHQIPDNENAYHAGDGSRAYQEIDTGIKADTNNPYPQVTISKDGYYEIAGQKTNVVAPMSRPKTCSCGKSTQDGRTTCSSCGKSYGSKICTNSQINSFGIRTGILENGNYFIGNTYYNTTYGYISNAGGNNNAIGIEMCVNQNSDIFYTWQKNAKLVAKLLVENNLALNDVKPHHFFSGKDCPATMLHADMWDMFMEMVEAEYNMLTMFAGYKITFESHDLNFLGSNGKVLKQAAISKSVSYTITVEKDGISESITLCAVIPGRYI